jgi:hypothetical protein
LIKHTAKRTLKITIEVLIGLAVILCLLGGFAAWKLSQGPVALDRFIPYVTDYFNAANEENIAIEGLTLNWESLSEPLALSAKNVVVSNDRGPFLFSPEIDFSLKAMPLLIGNIDLEAVWIRKITLSVTRDENGQISISGQAQEEDTLPDETVPAQMTLNDLIYDLPDLDYFWIDEARIFYKDLRLQKTNLFEPVTLYIENEQRNNARMLSGYLSLPFGNSETDNLIRLNFETMQEPLALNVYGGLEDLDVNEFFQFLPPMPEGFTVDAIVNADIRFQLDNLWALQGLSGMITAENGSVSYPIDTQSFTAEFSDLNLETIRPNVNEPIELKTLAMRLNDTVDIRASGSVTNIDNLDKLAGQLDLNVSNLPESYFERYWPEAYQDNGAYRWLGEKIEGGIFSSVNFKTAFDKSLTVREDGLPIPPWLTLARAEFTYQDLTINYNEPMLIAENVNGTGVFDMNSLTLAINDAIVGGMVTREATLDFEDLIVKGKGSADMTFPVTAEAQQVFDYIAVEPIAAFDNIDFKPANTQGNVDATVRITMPLLKDTPIEDIDLNVKGTVTEALIPDAVRGLSVSGGPFDVEATTRDLKVDGSGSLGGQALTVDWHEYFSPQTEARYLSKIKVEVNANETIRRAFIEDIAQYFEGNSPIKLDYETKKNKRDTVINLDINLNQTAITYEDIGVIKPANSPANARLRVNLANGNVKSIDNLTITGRDISLEKSHLDFRTEGGEPVIIKVALDNARYEKGQFSLLAAEEDGLLKVTMTGDYLDVTRLLSTRKDGDEAEKTSEITGRRPMEIGITVDRMRTAEDASISQPKLYARLNAQGKIERFELDAYLGETLTNGQLYLRYTPEVADGLSLRIESNNAGELLRSLDLYPHIRGGNLQIAGRPIEGGRFGDVQGRARIDNFSVSDAPIFLRLVNALSFQSFLQADSLRFDRLESDFKWRLGEQGDSYEISNGRTSGTSVALTFDGFVNTADDNMQIKGTAAPLSELNKIVGDIPIIGQLLTGGGALLAATYTISGNPDDPSVTVNPLSVLAPGIIRKMLFESNPDMPAPDAEKRPARAQKERVLN